MAKDNREVSVGEVVFLQETQLAILVEQDADDNPFGETQELWIPKSQVSEGSEVPYEVSIGNSGELILSEWFAKKEGWVEDD